MKEFHPCLKFRKMECYLPWTNHENFVVLLTFLNNFAERANTILICWLMRIHLWLAIFIFGITASTASGNPFSTWFIFVDDIGSTDGRYGTFLMPANCSNLVQINFPTKFWSFWCRSDWANTDLPAENFVDGQFSILRIYQYMHLYIRGVSLWILFQQSSIWSTSPQDSKFSRHRLSDLVQILGSGNKFPLEPSHLHPPRIFNKKSSISKHLLHF